LELASYKSATGGEFAPHPQISVVSGLDFCCLHGTCPNIGSTPRIGRFRPGRKKGWNMSLGKVKVKVVDFV